MMQRQIFTFLRHKTSLFVWIISVQQCFFFPRRHTQAICETKKCIFSLEKAQHLPCSQAHFPASWLHSVIQEQPMLSLTDLESHTYWEMDTNKAFVVQSEMSTRYEYLFRALLIVVVVYSCFQQQCCLELKNHSTTSKRYRIYVE